MHISTLAKLCSNKILRINTSMLLVLLTQVLRQLVNNFIWSIVCTSCRIHNLI